MNAAVVAEVVDPAPVVADLDIDAIVTRGGGDGQSRGHVLAGTDAGGGVFDPVV